MTDITELAQRMKAAAEKATPGRIGDRIDGSGSIKYQCFGNDGSLVLQTDHKNMEYGFIGPNAEADELFFRACAPENILALVDALEKAQQVPVIPLGLHPDTQKLVTDFCTALAEKLYKAQLKYGYDADWKQDGWTSQCLAHFHQHIAKGDPRDVAAYCAFMWWHGWSTKPAEGLESRTVTVKLPDYRHERFWDSRCEEFNPVEYQAACIEMWREEIIAQGIKVEAD